MQSLVVVSFAILAVMAVLAAMTVRRGKKGIAAYALPVCSIPVLHLAAALLRLNRWHMYFDAAGLVLGVVLCALFSRAIPSGAPRRYYVVTTCVFLAILLTGYLLG